MNSDKIIKKPIKGLNTKHIIIAGTKILKLILLELIENKNSVTANNTKLSFNNPLLQKSTPETQTIKNIKK